MLYKEVQHYQPQLQHKDQLLLMDLTILSGEMFKQQLVLFSNGDELTAQSMRKKLQDSLLRTKDLYQKLGAIILPTDSIYRKFTFDDAQDQLQGTTPFTFCSENNQQNLQIGIKVPLNDLQVVQKLKEKCFSKVKIYSFDLHEKLFKEEIPQLLEKISAIIGFNKNRIFHLNVTLQTINGLKDLKRQLIKHHYPIEYCYLQTNLLNLISLQCKLDINVHWQEIAFKYCEVIKKYVPASIGCLLQHYCIHKQVQSSLDTQNAVNQCISLINRRRDSDGQKENKIHHNTGVSITENAIYSLLSSFQNNLSGYRKVRGSFDSIVLVKMHQVLSGKYKPEPFEFQ